MPKRHYRVRNWNEYNESLVQRGSIAFWIDEKIISQWYSKAKKARRGRPLHYADSTIESALTIRAVFHLTLRATEGFMQSLLAWAKLPLEMPDYTTLCKRQKTLAIKLPGYYTKGKEKLHIVIDSTGLKVFGEGEWKVRQHGYSKHRTWRKLQIALDVKSQEIVCAMLTTNDCHDKEMLQEIVEAIEAPIAKVGGDGAYESHANYDYLDKRKITALIPPRKDARIKQHGNCKAPAKARDKIVREVRRLGRKRWKQESGYHQRSLVETAMFRLKTLFGDHLRNRIFEHQATEAFIRCRALNLITQLGMPDSYIVSGNDKLTHPGN